MKTAFKTLFHTAMFTTALALIVEADATPAGWHKIAIVLALLLTAGFHAAVTIGMSDDAEERTP